MDASYQIAFASSQEPDMNKREYLMHISLILWPQNAEVAKTLAYALECFGHTSAAKSLYAQCYFLSGNLGCGLHFMLAAPTILWNSIQAKRSFKNILADFHVILSDYSSVTDGLRGFFCTQSHRQVAELYIGNQRRSVSLYPGCSDLSSHQNFNFLPVIDSVLQSLPLNPQYLGRPPSIVYSLLGVSISTLYHSMLSSLVPSDRFLNIQRALTPLSVRVLRLGVVSGLVLPNYLAKTQPVKVFPFHSRILWKHEPGSVHPEHIGIHSRSKSNESRRRDIGFRHSVLRPARPVHCFWRFYESDIEADDYFGSE